MPDIRYVSEPKTFLVRNPGGDATDSGSVQLLLGARLHVDESASVSGFVPATSMPNKNGDMRSGFVDVSRISESQQLKVFYLDVGQGDATLIEAEDAIIIIDGGPNRGFQQRLPR